MTGLPCSEKTITISSAIPYNNRIQQTDRWTDRQNYYIISARQCADMR